MADASQSPEPSLPPLADPGEPDNAACRFTLLTPPGRGAVATLAVYGPRATETVARWFQPANGKSLRECRLGTLVFGRWFSGGWEDTQAPVAEELVVCRHGPEQLEVHCHGGRAAVESVSADLATAGALAGDTKNWAQLREPDPIAAAARLALATAQTAHTAAVLLDQYRGALRTSLQEVKRLVRDRQDERALEALGQISQFDGIGEHLTEPWRIALAGPPNAGKSSLMNRLLGFQRAVVHATPGATRDVLTGQTAFDGWPVELSDMAGLRDSRDQLELDGMARARDQLQQADVVLLVFDVSCAWAEQDQQVLDEHPNAMVIHNKIDVDVRDASRPAGLPTSALTGEGLPELIEAVVANIAPSAPQPNAAVAFIKEQRLAISTAANALRDNDPTAATESLDRIL